jgi:gliding motility associated protien GldN
MKISTLWATIALSVIPFAQNIAQEVNDGFGYNPQSVRPIFQDDQLTRKSMWYRIDLKEKQNKPLMAKGSELAGVIIDAVKAGILRPFSTDSLATRMSYDQFMQNITIPNQGVDSDWIGDIDTNWPTDEPEENIEKPAETTVANEYFAKDFKILELKEDLIFDKKRSLLYHDIQAITIYLPAELNPTGIEKAIASFSYKELVENVFRDNPHALWYNNQNPHENRNFEEAFELRLFAAHLTKYSNSEDSYIEDIYGIGKSALISSIQAEHAMLQTEVDMWEN